jgi:hypothetical protein
VCAFRLFIQRHVPHSVRPKKLSLLKVGGNEDVAADNAIKLAGANYGLANQYADASCIKIAPAEATNPLDANQVLFFIALPPGKNVQSSNWMSMQPSGGNNETGIFDFLGAAGISFRHRVRGRQKAKCIS